ncbi:hypothetical protein N5923_12400 [Erwiniaceae bacterium BAC15a-03b]|uniref:Uncharacterized protein n=1 Tax=Winslowiella arboricola TaxID=2978220 RepID=A0A9J6PRL5_9GAMM|nr:hypothetical protein [Winslowiella arboricola]MCU5772743.1 hypothetical protein [Winslowiella arboricola]MCU5778293.1 hypothetical protein [Winslowiella arboricola]
MLKTGDIRLIKPVAWGNEIKKGCMSTQNQTKWSKMRFFPLITAAKITFLTISEEKTSKITIFTNKKG